MKRTNGDAKGGALFKKGIADGALRLRLDARDQQLQAVIGGFPVVRIGGHGQCRSQSGWLGSLRQPGLSVDNSIDHDSLARHGLILS